MGTLTPDASRGPGRAGDCRGLRDLLVPHEPGLHLRRIDAAVSAFDEIVVAARVAEIGVLTVKRLIANDGRVGVSPPPPA